MCDADVNLHDLCFVFGGRACKKFGNYMSHSEIRVGRAEITFLTAESLVVTVCTTRINNH
jgi:hypothetical protein